MFCFSCFKTVVHSVVPACDAHSSSVQVSCQHHNEPHSSRSESQFEPFLTNFWLARRLVLLRPSLCLTVVITEFCSPVELQPVDPLNRLLHQHKLTLPKSNTRAIWCNTVGLKLWPLRVSEHVLNSRDDLRQMKQTVVCVFILFFLHDDCLRV